VGGFVSVAYSQGLGVELNLRLHVECIYYGQSCRPQSESITEL